MLGSAVQIFLFHTPQFIISSLITFTSSMPFIAPSIYLFFGLPLLLLEPSTSICIALFTPLPFSPFHMFKPSQSCFCHFQLDVCYTTFLSNLLIPLFVHPYFTNFSSFPTAQHSAPYRKTGLITALYNLDFSFLGIFLSYITPVISPFAPCCLYPLSQLSLFLLLWPLLSLST